MASFHAQLNEALIRQKQRMEQAFPLEQEERRQRRQRAQTSSGPQAGAPGPSGLKHGLEPESSADAVKRAKLDVNGARVPNSGEVDISSLVLERIVDGVMGGLGAISMENLLKRLEVSSAGSSVLSVRAADVQSAKQALIDDTPDAIPLLAASFGVVPGQPQAEEAVLNPLDMDLDDDEDDLLVR
jgi:symplekin